MGTTVIEGGVSSLLQEALRSNPDEMYLHNPSSEVMAAIIATTDLNQRETVLKIFAQKGSLKTAMGDFRIASHAADLESDNVLSMRSGDSSGANTVLVTHDRVIAIVAVGDWVAGVSTDKSTFVDQMVSAIIQQWETGEPFTHRTPPRSVVDESLSLDIGESARDDFAAMLNSLDSVRSNGVELDEVMISLLVAAKNEQLLYDISKWGEDVGIASKATFSRTKTRLEDAGLIKTEKVPIDVGRPRLRLKLRGEPLVGANAEDILTVAAERLRGKD